MATMTSIDPNIRDHMTAVQLRLIKEKLAEERDRAGGASSHASSRSRMSTTRIDESSVKLHQAMLKRQELMEKLRKEERIREDLSRSYSSQGRRHIPPPPPSRASSRRSLQDYPPQRSHAAPTFYTQQPPHYQGGGSPHQIVEHQVRPIRLEPIQHAPPPQPQQAQVMPMVIPSSNGSNAKQDMMEMMMMQNAQMHSMMMQQMMMSTIPKPPPPPPQQPAMHLDVEDLISLKSERKRPKSVHHHHYSPPPQPQQQYTLPPLMPQYAYPSPRYFPMEAEPLKQPVARRKKTPKYKPPPFNYGPLPFPGPWALRKFRHAAYAAFFAKSAQKLLQLKKQGKSKKDIHANISPSFLFGIRLKEAVAALHHIYLQSDNKIGGILRRVSNDGAKDLTVVLQGNNVSAKEKAEAYKDLAFIIENTAFEMTEIMPTGGVLGTHRKAVVYDMLLDGKTYPSGYLWQIEKNLLSFDGNGRVVNLGNNEATYLLAGMYIARAVVTTLCLRPEEYGLTKNRPGHQGQQNLKLLATLYIYMLRRIYSTGKNTVPAPYEIGKFLFKDDQMAQVYQKLKKSFDYSEKILKQWGLEYSVRIRNAPPV